MSQTKKKGKPRPKGPKKKPVPGLAELATHAEPVEPEPAGPVELAAGSVDAAAEQAGVVFTPDDPRRLAEIHMRAAHHHGEGATLVAQGDDFLAWDGRCYGDVSAEIPNALLRTIWAEFEGQNKSAVAGWAAMPDGPGKARTPPRLRKASGQLVANVKMSLRALVALPGDMERPCWLGTDGEFPAREVLAFPNCLLHLPSFDAGIENCLIGPTPRYYSTRCFPFEFDPDAPSPERWLEFLGQVFGDDRDAIRLLQEWFGYCLLDDTLHQKIMMLIGPSRCGKGTIARVLAQLLGPDNVAGPSFASLTERFGLEPLIGKAAAVVGDARLSGRGDQSVIVERLLSISGEDRVTVDRKNRAAWQGTLPTRLMLLSNELPELRDASNAFTNRLLIAAMKRSFLGQEDPHLTSKLTAELPGILLWAIEGWWRLQDRGRFRMPESSAGSIALMKGLSSPISAFVDECCVVGPNRKIRTSLLYEAYRSWCLRQGTKHPLIQAKLGQGLKAVVPGIENRRFRPPGQQGKVPHYFGIGVRSSALPAPPPGGGPG